MDRNNSLFKNGIIEAKRVRLQDLIPYNQLRQIHPHIEGQINSVFQQHFGKNFLIVHKLTLNVIYSK